MDCVLSLKPCTDSSSPTAMPDNFTGWGEETGSRSNAYPMAQSGNVLNTSTGIGWKWARCEDAEWMFDDYISNIYSDRTWGLKKGEL